MRKMSGIGNVGDVCGQNKGLFQCFSPVKRSLSILESCKKALDEGECVLQKAEVKVPDNNNM